VRSLNLYSNNVQNITSGNRKDFAFPVNECTTAILTLPGQAALWLNGVIVYNGGISPEISIITLGKKGLYKFNTQLNLFNSVSLGVIMYSQNARSEKMLQIDQGRIVNSTLNLNITGAIKLHLIHDTSGDLYINNVFTVPATGPGTIVIDIGNDVDIINDTLIIQNVGSQTGYIIERLI
jgi:hypothetical protein